MIELTLYLAILLPVLALYLHLRLHVGHRRIYLPDSLVLSTGSHTVGALIVFGQSHSLAASFILESALLSFVTAAFLTIWALVLSKRILPETTLKHAHASKAYTLGLIGVVAVNLLIVALIFSNPAIATLIVASFIGTDDTTLLAVRKAITASTEGYMSPGLIKLVRDQIGPIVIVSFILSRARASRSILLWLGVGCSLGSMLVGGQRFPVVMMIAALALAFIGRRAIEGRALAIGPKQILQVSGGILFIFYAMSALLGRTAEGESGIDAAIWSIVSLLERAFSTLPHEAESTFYFWSRIGPTWGLSWMADLTILLPGVNASFSNQLHELTGGSAEGNAVLFFAADAWMAFGWTGIVFTTLLFVTVFHLIDTVLWRARSPRNDAARIVLFLNAPLMYSPYLFLLYGGIVVLIIVAWTLAVQAVRATQASATQHRRATS